MQPGMITGQDVIRNVLQNLDTIPITGVEHMRTMINVKAALEALKNAMDEDSRKKQQEAEQNAATNTDDTGRENT